MLQDDVYRYRQCLQGLERAVREIGFAASGSRSRGIVNVSIATTIEIEEQNMSEQDRRVSQPASREANADAYEAWLAAEIQASIDDPRLNVTHEEVMAELDVAIADLNPGSCSSSRPAGSCRR